MSSSHAQLIADCSALIRPILEAVGEERWGSQDWLLFKHPHYRLTQDKNLLNSLTEPETYQESFLPMRWLLLGNLLEKTAERGLPQCTGRKVDVRHRGPVEEIARWVLERATWQGYTVLVATAPKPLLVVNSKEYSPLRQEDLHHALLRTSPIPVHLLTQQYETSFAGYPH